MKLLNYTLDYVVLGKFLTDNHESRFGQCRQLSGCNCLSINGGSHAE